MRMQSGSNGRWTRCNRILVGAAAVALLAGCSTPAPDGPDDGDMNSNGTYGGGEPVDATSPAAVPGLFAADQFWSLAAADAGGATGAVVFGVGDLVEFATILPGNACFAILPESQIDYSNGVLSFATDFSTKTPGDRCRVAIAASAAACLAGGATAQTCDLSGGTYTMIADGQTVAVQSAGWALPQECPTLPGTLFTYGDWSIVSLHPIALPFAAPASNFGETFVAVGGNGSSVQSATLCTEVSGDACTGCSAVLPEGTVSFDGQTLTLDLTFTEDPASCAVSFTGQATACGVYAEEGASGNPVIRVVGEGTYQQADESGEIDVLYFTGDPDGNVRM